MDSFFRRGDEEKQCNPRHQKMIYGDQLMPKWGVLQISIKTGVRGAVDACDYAALVLGSGNYSDLN
ncbi:MAG: hypothetical protein R3D86_02635 [Emcibacteraceae bacterium]